MTNNYGPNDNINGLRNELGLDFEARLSTSDVLRTMCDFHQQALLWSQKNTDKKESRHVFPENAEEEKLLE